MKIFSSETTVETWLNPQTQTTFIIIEWPHHLKRGEAGII